MAKKFVRGITDVKTINNQDFDTNNVNDLLSDGQYNYIHRKKGKNEEYHNLTDNIKTLSSDNTELLSVTNYNKTTNTALLFPKHDKQKEQVLEAGNSTITIEHGGNSTNEKTKVKVSDALVETINNKQDKLTAGDGLSIDSNNITINPKRNENLTAKNGIYFGDVAKEGIPYAAISLSTDYNKYVQVVFRESVNSSGKIVGKYRFINNNTPTEWNEMLIDNATIRDLLAQKQNKLTAGEGITIQDNVISATGATSTIEHFEGNDFADWKHVVTNGNDTFVTYTFNVNSGTPQVTFVNDLKNDLEKFVGANKTVSNGALKLTNDGTDIKLINSKSTESGWQQGTFTF